MLTYGNILERQFKDLEIFRYLKTLVLSKFVYYINIPKYHFAEDIQIQK